MTHRILPNFSAPGTEVFPDGCGPYAICVALHSLEPDHYEVNTATLNAIKGAMVQRGWWIFENGVSGGCNVEQIANYLSECAGYNVQYWSSYGQGAPLVIDDGKPDCFHVLLRGADGSGGGAAGVRPILFETNNGSELVGNQQVPHVGRHWVTVGGLDSTLGYLVGNGDEAPAVGPLWNDWARIYNSRPIAVLLVGDKKSAPKPPAPDIAGAIADLKAALGKLGG